MGNFTKKLLCILLASILVLGLISCKGGDDGSSSASDTGSNSGNTSSSSSDSSSSIDDDSSGGEQTPPESEVDKDVFLIGSWVTYYDTSITSLDEQMKLLSECGVNFNYAPYAWSNVTTIDEHDDVEDWKKISALCDKYGIFFLTGSPKGGRTQEGYEEALTFADNIDSEYFLGYTLWDEPNYDRLEEMGEWYKKYKQEDPDHLPFVNLAGGSGVAGIDLKTHARKYVEVVGKDTNPWLSYDCYPFRSGNTTLDNVKFMCMEVIRQVGYESGKLKTHSFPQSTGFNIARMPNLDEITWDCWAYVAYGFKALSYFNYVCPGLSDTEGECFNESLIYRDGTIHDQALFDGVAKLNWQLRAVGDVLMKYDCVHAYHTVKGAYGNNVEYLPDGYFIQAEGNKDHVISIFEPKKEGDPVHIMLLNNSWTQGNTITYNLDEYSGIEKLEYFNPETKTYEDVDISSNTFTVDFSTGEGRLYRVTGVPVSAMY